MTDLRTDAREILVTTVIDAVPDARHRPPGASIWPLVAALATAVLLITLIFTPWAVVIGGALLLAALLGWAWPRGSPHEPKASEASGS